MINMIDRLRKIGFSKLTSVKEATEKLFSKINFTQAEEIKINNALRRITAEVIRSKIDVPSFDRAAMDGYAVIAEDTFGASPKKPKNVKRIGKIEIGEVSSLSIHKGEAIRISTGAALPDGADAVIMIEDTEKKNEEIIIYNPVAPGKNVSKQGEDIKKDEIIIEKGTELGAEHIALISSQGIENILVKKKPEVSIYATGMNS